MDDKIKKVLLGCVDFEWDDGNLLKNWDKHQVTPSECEQIYFNKPLFLKNDINHSLDEIRLYALGRTDENRKLFIAFTVRNNQIRVISARDMSRKEREVYETL